MADLRSDVEKKLQDLIDTAMSFLGAGKLGQADYRDTMGALRDAVALLENKRLGCVSGKHRISCYCDEGIEYTKNAVEKCVKEKTMNKTCGHSFCRDASHIDLAGKPKKRSYTP